MLFRRRTIFVMAVLASQLLLIAMALAWCVHMVIIAKVGEVYFVEENPMILYGEITATVIVTLFAIIMFALQYKRLGEKRRGDDKERDDQG